MSTTIFVPPEGPRYSATLVFLPGLWTGSEAWRPIAGYLAHRGWEGRLLDLRAVRGGLQARAASTQAALRGVAAPPILVGHDAGGLVALAAASLVAVRALVLVSPLVPGAAGTHAIAWSPGLVWALLARRRIDPPHGPLARALFDVPSSESRGVLVSEDPRLLAELCRRVRVPRPSAMPPTLVLRGAEDRIVSLEDVHGFAGELGAETVDVPAHGHWLLDPPASEECVDRIHRWLVRQLGEDLLELHAEAMAERNDTE